MNTLYLSTDGDMTTHLPIPLEMEGFGCGVIEIMGKIPQDVKEPLFLCCNICEESIVGNIKMPILRCIKRNKSGLINSNIYNIIWLRVMRPTISSIRLYISNAFGKIISLGDEQLYCTLLFIPRK